MNREEQRRIAEKFAPIFYQEIGWRVRKNPNQNSPPETDFLVDHDFDGNHNGWLPESKLAHLNLLLDQKKLREEDRISYYDWGCEIDTGNGYITLNLRPIVFFAVMASETQYFVWYLVYHPKDSASIHGNDLEASLVIVDRKSELVIALQPFGHNQTSQFPTFEFWQETLERHDRFIDRHRTKQITGFAAVKIIQDGSEKKYCPEVFIEMWGHGHRGVRIQRGQLDCPLGYVAYFPCGSYSWSAPPFNSALNLAKEYDPENLTKVSRGYALIPFGDSLEDDSYYARSRGNTRPLIWRDEIGTGRELFSHPILTLLNNFGVGNWRNSYEVSKEYTFNPYRR